MAGINADQLRQILQGARGGGRRVEPFSSGDEAEWLGWRQNFTITAAINGWDNRRQRREIAVAMTGAAKQYVANIPVGDGLPAGLAPGAVIPDAQYVTLLLNLHEQRFLPAAASDITRVNFHQASQKEGESIIAWSARLRLLHSRAYPNMPAADQETNTDLIEAFVVRLSNKVTADRVWNWWLNTYAAALNYAKNAAAGQRILNQPVPQQPPKQEPRLFHIGLDDCTAAVGAARPRGAGDRCFGCDRTGHQVRDCPLLRRLLQEQRRGAGGGRGGGAGGGRVRGGCARRGHRPRGPGHGAGGRGGHKGRGGAGLGQAKNARHRQLRVIQAILNGDDLDDWDWEDAARDGEDEAAGNE